MVIYTDDYTVWQRRFNNLNSRIIALQQFIENTKTLYRYQTLYKLTECLQAFADQQFSYFYQGFAEGGGLKHSREFPPSHVLTVTLQQISYDLEAIQWAVEQRLHKQAEIVEALQIGDRLAWAALKPALNLEQLDLDGDITVVTYFQKFAEIRVIPYASVALVGLPITCIGTEKAAMVARDYLATPHEVGHYVYWHAKILPGSGSTKKQPLYQYLEKKVADQEISAREWLEEIFADVYGCLVAGPVIAQSFQDLQLRIRRKWFLTDDREHPTPYIRPDIYTKVLHKHKQFNTGWAARMHQLWRNKRKGRELDQDQGNGEAQIAQQPENGRLLTYNGVKKRPADFISMLDSQDSPLIDGEADKPVDIMINLVLETLAEIEKPEWWWQYEAIESDPPAEFDLYDSFRQHVLKDDSLPPEPPDQDNIACKPAKDLHKQWYLQKVRDGDPDWLPVFQAGGWATKGPENNPVGG
jgi:hypothetical protein